MGIPTVIPLPEPIYSEYKSSLSQLALDIKPDNTLTPLNVL
jgi:hypothetical protein